MGKFRFNRSPLTTMNKKMLKIKQVKELDSLLEELERHLPPPLFDKLLTTQMQLVERLGVQIQITDFLANKVAILSNKLLHK